jgi:hypothetical protein
MNVTNDGLVAASFTYRDVAALGLITPKLFLYDRAGTAVRIPAPSVPAHSPTCLFNGADRGRRRVLRVRRPESRG